MSYVVNNVYRKQNEIEPVDTGKEENVPPLLVPVYIYDLVHL